MLTVRRFDDHRPAQTCGDLLSPLNVEDHFAGGKRKTGISQCSAGLKLVVRHHGCDIAASTGETAFNAFRERTPAQLNAIGQYLKRDLAINRRLDEAQRVRQ